MLRIGTLLFGLGAFMLLTRMLTKVDFGQWHLFIMITGLIEVARNGLIQNGLVKHLVGEEGEVYKEIATASFVLNILLTLVFGGVILILSPFLSHWLNAPDLTSMIQVYLITLGVMTLFSQAEFFQQANYNFKGIFWGYVTRLGLLFGFVLFCFLNNSTPELLTLAWVHVGCAIVGMLVMLGFSHSYWRLHKHISWDWVKRLFHYGKYVFGTNLSAMLLNNIDTWMLSGIINPAAAASYGAALRVNQMIEVPTGALAATVFPKSAHLHKTEGNASSRYLYEKSVGSLLAVILPGILFVLLVPEWIITLLAGSNYLDAAPVLTISILFGLFIPFNRQFGTILDSIGKPQLNFVFILGGAVLNICLNYLFIKILGFGLIGAAFATLCTHFCTFTATQIVLRNLLEVRISRIFRYAWQFYPEILKKGKSAWTGLRKSTPES